jgi:hypothetical protein
MDIVVLLTVVIPAGLVAFGFYFFVISVMGVGEGSAQPAKSHQSRKSRVAATYWGRYQTPNACLKPPKETISLPRISPQREPTIHIDPNWN